MEFELGPYTVGVASEFGPRIVTLSRGSGANVLAELPRDITVGPAGDPFRFRGGHRVWAAPEVPEITYAPDERPCVVTNEAGTVTVSAGPDRAGIVKELSLATRGDSLVVRNVLTVSRDLDGEVAPWAITQFPQGGVAILPIAGEETGPQANRRLVLWPYTSLDDPRLSFRSDVVVVDASGVDALKIGTGPSPGRLGYWLDGQLFTKEIESAGRGEVPDLGAVGQVYVGAGFCELESVGPLTTSSKGTVASIEEVWSVDDCPDPGMALEIVTSSGSP